VTPEGYRPVGRGAFRGFALPECADWLASLLGEPRTVHGWAAERPSRERMQGRGATWAVPAPCGAEAPSRWAVRHYLRGGLAAHALHDRYLRSGPNRPSMELSASEAARRRGVPTPRVVLGAWYLAGPFYRADLVTEMIPSAMSLSEALRRDAERARQAGGPEGSGADLMHVVGRLVRDAAARGLEHPDLNAGNVVVRTSAAEPEAWIIDLDGARVHDVPSASHGPRMMARLERSLRKLGAAASWDTGAAIRALRTGFEGVV